MKTKAISILNKFKCLGASCPNTCCRNWNVTVDETTYENYKHAKGAKKYTLLASTKRVRGFRVMRTLPGKGCIYHKDGLCQFQCEGHLEWMPEICRNYPRRILQIEDQIEVTLELSCVEMARIYLEHPGRLHFSETKEWKPQWILENHDEKFLRYLMQSREGMLDFLWREDGQTLTEDMYALYHFMYEEHRLLMRNGLDTMLSRLEQGESPLLDTSNLDEEDTKRKWKNRKLFYPATIMNDVIYIHLWYTMIPFRNPYLYRALKAYDKQFGQVREADADAYLNQKMKEMLDAMPELRLKYRSYLSYCIQELYLECYEDYYLIGKMVLILLYVQSLQIFDLSMYLEYQELSLQMQAEILSGAEKGMRHSLDSERQFLEKIRTDFMNSDK